MARRNLGREVHHLVPIYTPPPSRVSDAIQRARLVEAICRVCEASPEIMAGTDAARQGAIRLIWLEHVAAAKKHWLFGKPTEADLSAVDRRVSALLGVAIDEVAVATQEHRPATAA